MLNSLYFKIHVSTGDVIQTMNTSVLFKGKSSTLHDALDAMDCVMHMNNFNALSVWCCYLDMFH